MKGTGHLKLLAVLSLLVGACYLNSLHNDFVGDDASLVVENPSIVRIDRIPILFARDYWADFRGAYERAPVPSSGLYRPLTVATYAVNYALGGLDPAGYHVVNAGLHLLISWLVYLIAVQVGLGWEAALAGAALFAVHPLHTEAVTQVVGRAELLMSLGVLGAILAHLRGRTALALAAFGAGLFSKEQAMVLPFLLLMYDVCIARRFSKEGTEETAPFSSAKKGTVPMPETGTGLAGASPLNLYAGYFLLLVAYLAIRAKVLGGMSLPPVSRLENPLPFLDWAPRLLTTVKVAGLYLGLFIWPAVLLPDYSDGTIPVALAPWEPGFLWGVMSWGALLCLGGWALVRRERPVWLGVVVSVLTFLPVSNLAVPIGTIMAERLFYLPSAGLCLLVAAGYEAARRGPSPGAEKKTGPLGASPLFIHALRLAVLLVCLALSVRTIVRNQDWKDAETLFRQATAMAPNNAKAYVFLSGALKKQGRYAEALKASDAAVRLHPSALQHDAHHLWQRGIILVKLGLAAAAVDALEQAATADPRYGGIREDLGLAYAAAGDYRRAESAMRWALALTPDSPHVHSSLSFVLNEQGRHAEALEAAEAALQRNPKHVWAWFNKAEALEGMGRRNEAAAAYERVLALPAGPTDQPALERARANRLRLLAEQ